jgi:hypothetical protein
MSDYNFKVWMHLKVFWKLEKPKTLSLLGKYILKNPKNPKKTKKPKNQKKHWAGFFPTLPVFGCSRRLGSRRKSPGRPGGP